MRIWPVFLDSRPAYLGGASSLLLSPFGTTALIEHVGSAIRLTTSNPPLVLAPPDADAHYADQIRALYPNAEVVSTPAGLASKLAAHEMSDAVLLVDPRCMPADVLVFAQLVRHHTAEPRLAHHLVAFDRTTAGTKERICFDQAGHVRAIQRHYEQATWPFIAGVAATMLPASSGIGADGELPDSLNELRQLLISRGVPTRDIPFETDVLDLTDERSVLAANDYLIFQATANSGDGRGTSTHYVGTGHTIHPSARLMGPVVLHAGASIGPQALVLGPAVVGANATIGDGAVVANAVLGSGSVVPPGVVVRDRTWFTTSAETAPVEQDRPVQPFAQRLALLAMDRRAPLSHQQDQVSYQRHLTAKRVLDVAVAILGLTLLSPLLLLIAAAVWLESRGPIFYGDKREGFRGRVFHCWKFRTMFSGAHLAQLNLKALDQTDGPHFKADHDPRVTRVGRVLRALNVDEIPQLFNVLVGQMSLVGPRPSPFRENQVCVPWRAARLSVRPGITGFWQVCRHDRAAGDFHQWIEYDLLYVQHLTVWLDLKIISATLLTLGGKLGHVNASSLVTVSSASEDDRGYAEPVPQAEVRRVA